MSATAEPTVIERAQRIRDQINSKKVALRVLRKGPLPADSSRKECKLQNDIEDLERQLHSLVHEDVLMLMN